MTGSEEIKNVVKKSQDKGLTPEEEKAFKEKLKKDIIAMKVTDGELISEKKVTSGKTVINYIKMGNELLKARKLLYGQLYTVINDNILKRKTIQRYIKLVLTVESSKAFSRKGNKSNETIDSLEADTRVTDLIENGVEGLTSPSFSKINNMKELSNSDFKAVLEGDNEPYSELLKQKKDERDAKKQAEREELEKKMQPVGMDKKVYERLLEGGIFHVIDELHDKNNEIIELNNQIRALDLEVAKMDVENEVQSDMITDLNQSTPKPYLKAVGN